MRTSTTKLPDITDDATLGGFRTMLRDAWGPGHRVEIIDAGDASSVLVYDHEGLRCGVKRLPFADVLVAALEAAP